MIYSQSFFRSATGYVVFARSKDTPRTGPPISVEMGPSTKPWMALPSGCIAGSRRAWRHLFSTSWQSFVARGAPPIHFGRGDGVERTQNLFTLAERCRYTRSVAHWLPK